MRGSRPFCRRSSTSFRTIDDLISLEKADLRETGGRNSRLKLMEQAFKKALAAGVTIVFGSGADLATIPHGRQADQFRYFVNGHDPGAGPADGVSTGRRMLNYGWKADRDHRKGKLADIIAVAGNPLEDVGRNGTRQVRDERRPGRAKRAGRSLGRMRLA